jgi:putative SOS response-associated peptidase YedK
VRHDKQKIPFHIRKKDSGLFALAGIWEQWREQQSNEAIESCAILTTAANSLVQPIHNRMPVIINDADFDEWLTGDHLHLHRLLEPYEWPEFEVIQVSTYVNNARNDGRECISAVQSNDIN